MSANHHEMRTNYRIGTCKNIDHLFHLPHGFFWAAADCSAGRKTQKERDACALHRLSRGEQPHYFNAGMFVMTPCMNQLEDFGEALNSGRCLVEGYAEQDFLNHYYKARIESSSFAYF